MGMLYNMSMKTILLAVIVFNLTAHGSDITCLINSCVYTDPTILTSSKTTTSGIYQNLNDLSNVNFFFTNDTVKSVSRINTSADINISTINSSTNAASKHTIISSLPNHVAISSSGVIGTNGKNSSVLCAERFRNGTYGTVAMVNFNNRHGINDVCDSIDLTYLKTNNFTCPSGYLESSIADIELEQLNEKRTCKANITKSLCAKKSYDLTCRSHSSGPYCCSDNSVRVFSNYTDNIIPTSYLSSIGKCNPLNCSIMSDGLFFDKTVRIYGESVKNSYQCLNDMMSVTFADNTISRSITSPSSSLIRNSIDLTGTLIVKNSVGVVVPASNYRVIITNVNELKSAGTELRGCFNLNGSADNNYSCDIKPGAAVSVKMRIIDFNGNNSNEIVTNISQNLMGTYWVATKTNYITDTFSGQCFTEISTLTSAITTSQSCPWSNTINSWDLYDLTIFQSCTVPTQGYVWPWRYGYSITNCHSLGMTYQTSW
jgi:hypothetical protein